MSKNPWIIFLQGFRKKNPQMSVVQAAKSAGTLYREAKKISNVVTKKVTATMNNRRRKNTKRHKRGNRRTQRR
jgi:hypothetical protein